MDELFEYIIEVYNTKGTNRLLIYDNGTEIWDSTKDDDMTTGAGDGTAQIGTLKTNAVTQLQTKGYSITLENMKQVTTPTISTTNNSINNTKIQVPIINTADGVNVEETTVISKTAQDKMLDNQYKSKSEIENSVPSLSISEKLSKIKLSTLNISSLQIPDGIDLTKLSLKDLINTSKINLFNFDLSKLKTSDLNINILNAMGFTTLAIIGLVKTIKDKIKEVDSEVKQERKESSMISTTSTTLSNSASSDITKTNDIDKYTKKRSNVKKSPSIGKYTADQRNRKDLLNSSQSLLNKKKNISYKENPNYGSYYNS